VSWWWRVRPVSGSSPTHVVGHLVEVHHCTWIPVASISRSGAGRSAAHCA
jgi:hypothetical protein